MSKIMVGELGINYGETGTPTGFKSSFGDELNVGDLVIASFERGHFFINLVVDYHGRPAIMGAVSRKLSDYYKIKKAIPFEMVTDEIVKHISGLKIVEPKRMTLKEIEQALGYAIELV